MFILSSIAFASDTILIVSAILAFSIISFNFLWLGVDLKSCQDANILVLCSFAFLIRDSFFIRVSSSTSINSGDKVINS